MSVHCKIPPFRNLDIYRLVVVRRLKQLDVASSFNVTPARISQVVHRVCQWVNHAIGDWLFPGRDDLRFYVALETEKIRVHELASDPETVLFVGTGISYGRQDRTVSELDDTEPAPNAQHAAHISAQPINSYAAAPSTPLAATSCDASDCTSPAITELAQRLAQLLIVWKKSRKLGAAQLKVCTNLPPTKRPASAGLH